MEPTYYTPSEVAGLLRVTRTTVYKMLRGGEIPSVRVGGQYRVSRRELDAYLKGRRAVPVAG